MSDYGYKVGNSTYTWSNFTLSIPKLSVPCPRCNTQNGELSEWWDKFVCSGCGGNITREEYTDANRDFSETKMPNIETSTKLKSDEITKWLNRKESDVM